MCGDVHAEVVEYRKEVPNGEEEVLYAEGQRRQENPLQDAEVSCGATTESVNLTANKEV